MRPLPDSPQPWRRPSDHLDQHVHAYRRDELLRCWSTRQLTQAVADGTVARILPRIYCGSRHVATPAVRGEALNLWHPRGLVTGALALHLYTSELPAPPEAAILVAHGTQPRSPNWARIVQGIMPRLAGLPGNVRCTPPERALLDAWRMAASSDREEVIWGALWAQTCTWRELQSEVTRAAKVPGRRRLERMLGWFADGATSPLEVRARHQTFVGREFREFERQVPVVLPSRVARPDMLHRRAWVAVELDGDRYHSTRDARDRDRARDTELTAAGYAVLHFGWRDIVDRPEWCRRTVLATVAGSLARPGRT